MPESRTPGPSVAFADVTKRYAGGSVAVDGVSLGIAGGSFVALVGTSGSGKSTLLKMINRLVEPSTGTIAIDGEQAGQAELHDLRRGVGYVFQNIGLFPHMTVAENIGIGLWLAGERIAGPASPNCSTSSICRAISPAACPMRCRAASASGSASRGRWRASPG